MIWCVIKKLGPCHAQALKLDLRLPGINVVDHFLVPQEMFETFHRTTTDDILMISWGYHDDIMIMIIFPKLSESILLVTLNLGVLTNDLHQWKRHPRTGQASTGQHRNFRISDLKWLMQFHAIPQEFSQHTFLYFLFKKWCQLMSSETPAPLQLPQPQLERFVEVRWSSLKCCELSSKQKALPQCAPAVNILERMLRCYPLVN